MSEAPYTVCVRSPTRLEARALDPDPPLVALRPALERLPRLVWLESAERTGGAGRWSLLGLRYGPVVRATIEGGDDGLARIECALAALREGLSPEAWRAQREALGLPFAGGAVGWIGYGHGRRFERVRGARPAPGRTGLWFSVLSHLVLEDRLAARRWLVGTRRGFAAAFEQWRRLCALARPGPAAPHGASPRAVAASFDRAGYERAVERAIAWIRAGDIFEANLSQQVVAHGHDAPLAVWSRLLEAAPAPMMALVRTGGHTVLSASPERFVRVVGRRCESWPIKGTRARSADPVRDAQAAETLRRSSKDRAELAMIVDLVRNDLGRVAEPGSVRVRDEAALVSFSTVHHLVGRVEARLAPGRSGFDLLRAAFPAGSITGAPKPRAMEIIEALEPVDRGVYTGAIGWIGADGDLDTNVAIRTIELEGGRARFGIGGAVTAESDPRAEYDETLAKGAALARALGFEIERITTRRERRAP
ncbi:MAG: anthranilate synthase component I family protein [Planctomycetota bacterium]|nr:MAG: anthranilate synthase component I family protein [Planctomycetota bacterium]